MMSMLELPLEIQQQLFNQCSAKDLNNLVCCSSVYHNSPCINNALWYHVEIANELLQESMFLQNHFNLMLMSQHTKVMKITNSRNLKNCWKENSGRLKRNANMNIKTLLEHYNSMTLYLTHAPIQAYRCLASVPHLSELRLTGVSHIFDADLLNICCHLTKLKVFSLDNSTIYDDDGPRVLNTIPRGYSVYYKNLSPSGFEELHRLTILEELILSNCPLAVIKLSVGSKLKRVKVQNCDKLTTLFSFVDQDAEVQTSRSLNNLQQLSINLCRNLSNAALGTAIPQMTGLEKLFLRNLSITDEIIEVICEKLGCIEKLNVGTCSRLTDASLRSISCLTTLKKLNIRCQERGDEPRYTNAGVYALLTLRNLEYFNCEGLMNRHGAVTSDFYGELNALKNLKELHAGFARFEDEVLGYIGRITTLERLNLTASRNISDEGLLNLAPLKSLNNLVLDFVNNVTPSGIARLKKSIPNLKDVIYRGCNLGPQTVEQ